MKILIPIDFSKGSRIATIFAIEISKQLKAEITLLYVMYMPGLPRVSLKGKEIENAVITSTNEDANNFISDIKKSINRKFNCTFEIISGYSLEDVIENYAIEFQFDLIIMGTKGSTGLKRILFGSNAAAVINNSSIPVISIPEQNEIKKIKKIGYATDLSRIKTEMKSLIPYAKIFNASVNIVHIITPTETKKINIENLVNELRIRFQYQKISFSIINNENVQKGLEAYVALYKPDLLAMFTHKLGFLEKITGKGNTRGLAFSNKIPLMTFKKY